MQTRLFSTKLATVHNSIQGFVAVVVALVLLAPKDAQAADPEYTIRGISRTTAQGWVSIDGGWVDRAEILKVRFSVDRDHEGTVPLVAGFFDSEKRLLKKFKGAPHLQMRSGTEYQDLPSKLEAGRIYDVNFPVAPSIASGSMRWSDFLVMLGKEDAAAHATYPKSGLDWEEYSLKGEEIKHAGTAAEGEALKLEFSGINRQKHANSVWLDNEWKRGVNVLKSKIRIHSGAAAGGFFVCAYFFDKEGNQILATKSPPQIELRRGSEYVTLPPFWENGKPYEVYFPIPPALETGSGRYQDVVIVFGNKEAAVAGVFPTSRTDIATLDFPEKALVAQTAAAGDLAVTE